MPRHFLPPLNVEGAQERSPLRDSGERDALVQAREGGDAGDPDEARPRRAVALALGSGGCVVLLVAVVCLGPVPWGRLAAAASGEQPLGRSTYHPAGPRPQQQYVLRSSSHAAGDHRPPGAAGLDVTYGAGSSTTPDVHSARSDAGLDTGEDDVGEAPAAASGPLVAGEVDGYLPAGGEGALEDLPTGKDDDPAAGCGSMREFYLYRAQSDAEYPEENVNAADLPGVLWYLHNEVVTQCPRKYEITRVLRFRVSMMPTAALQAQSKLFSPYVAFDSGKCTVPGCEQDWAETGFTLGCQLSAAGAMGGYDGQWFSLPGPCPQEERGDKTADCNASWPGGRCDDVTGDPTCTYSLSDAGEVRIDELTGILDYGRYCRAGGLEYDRVADTGVNMTFWTGIDDRALCRRRVQKLGDAFRSKYPAEPSLPRASCADCHAG